MKAELQEFATGTTADSWEIDELAEMEFVRPANARGNATVKYTVTKDGAPHVWELDCGKHKTRAKWLKSIESTVHKYAF
jgi:hypothetical protein